MRKNKNTTVDLNALFKGKSRIKKEDLNSLLKEYEKKKNALANNNARIELGSDFSKAKAFWSNLNGHKPKADDMENVVSTWKVMSSLASEEGIHNSSLVELAKNISDIFNLDYDVNNKSDIELSEFINDMVEQFRRDTQTEDLHKEGYKIIKASMLDIEVIDGKAYINTNNACVFTQDEIKIMRHENGGKIYSMRVVETSENGIFRELEMSKEEAECLINASSDCTYMMMYMGDKEIDEDKYKDMSCNELKKLIFRDGYYDIATGMHYNCAIQSASMKRSANYLFIPVPSWRETFELWFRITGTKNKEGFKKAFGDIINMSKTFTRVSSRGSSTLSLSKVSPEVAEVIKKFKVFYAKDTTTVINRKYYQLVGPDMYEERNNPREITDADGQGLIDVVANAEVSRAARRITNNEYEELVMLWNKHCEEGGDLATVIPQSRLGILISKMPHVWQIRHGSKKGIFVMKDLKTIEATKDYDIICPESVRKFVGGEWSEYPLEICNYLKKKKNIVYLNPQFISALDFENPNALNPIVEDLLQFMNESVTDIKKRMEFHKIFVSDNDPATAVGSFLVDAITTNTDLMNETQVQKWSLNQYDTMVKNLKIGRIPVPGMYSYMVFDPNYQINKIFGTNLPTLESGEFYHNGLDCKCGLFRSPLIHPFEAQKVQLVNKMQYWYLTDCAIFNGFDGTADRMGGGDFDGDICAIIPDNTWQGNIIVDGIRELDYDVWEPALSAKKVYFVPDVDDEEAMNNLIDYLVESAKVDRTGIITNYGYRSLEIANHLQSAVRFAKRMGCENLTFFHPDVFGRQNKYGATFVPQAMYNNGVKTFGLKAIVRGVYTEEPIGSGNFKVVWDNDSNEAIIGVKSFEEIEGCISDIEHGKSGYVYEYLEIVKKNRTSQGREIDGAKTGVGAEGVSGNDFTNRQKVINSPHNLLARQVALGKRSSEEKMDSTFINSFISLSPMGRVHDFIDKYLYNEDGTDKTGTFLDVLKNNGVDKSYVLWNLLTDEERAMLKTSIDFSDGSRMTLIELMAKFKSNYGHKIRNLKFASGEIKDELRATQGDDIKDEDAIGNLTVGKIKENQYIELEQYMQSLKPVFPNITMKVMAAACYFATYMSKDGNPTKGISFAWIIPDALLEIFSRANSKYGWVRVPNSAINVSIKDNILYADGKINSKINAYDCNSAPTKFINGRLYAWIQRRVSEVAEPSAVENTIVNGKTYTIKAVGFKYYSSANVEGWKKLVSSNNFMFDIKLDETGRIIMCINDMPIASIARGKEDIDMSSIELIGRKVKVVNNPNSNAIVFNDNSITNICVTIIE